MTLILLTGAVAACGSDDSAPPEGATVVELPGAGNTIDFDDIVYSRRLGRIIVPARRSGLYVVDPRTARATRLGRLGSADSADEGAGTIFVADRERRAIAAVDPGSGRTIFSFTTAAPIDYVRYVEPSELWISEPAASPSGIEVFTLAGDRRSARRSSFVAVPGGPEALTISARRHAAYTHAGADLVAIDTRTRALIGRWPTGCDGTHGFPQVDDRRPLVLASCADDGTVSLVSLDDGRQLGRFGAGGGEALPAHSDTSDHFYARGDPGATLVTLDASDAGLTKLGETRVPDNGHCLTADDASHVWTCDPDQGRVLRFDEP